VATGGGAEQFGPVVDGDILPMDPAGALLAGNFNHMPIVIGNNANETLKYVPRIATDADYRAAVTSWLGATRAAQVIAEYPSNSYDSPTAAFAAVTTDGRFVCPARFVTRAFVAHQSDAVRSYYFAHVLDESPARVYGAYHGLELPFVFHTLTSIAGFTPNAAEVGLADAMVGYWTRFAATGDPNGGAAPMWPTYGMTGADLQLDETITPSAGLGTSHCDFWDMLSGS
jgi:para-nitrobenzyl esterase